VFLRLLQAVVELKQGASKSMDNTSHLTNGNKELARYREAVGEAATDKIKESEIICSVCWN
jgi:hypothetical protein